MSRAFSPKVVAPGEGKIPLPGGRILTPVRSGMGYECRTPY